MKFAREWPKFEGWYWVYDGNELVVADVREFQVWFPGRSESYVRGKDDLLFGDWIIEPEDAEDTAREVADAITRARGSGL